MLPVSIDIVDNLAKDPDIFLGNQWKPKQSPNRICLKFKANV